MSQQDIHKGGIKVNPVTYIPKAKDSAINSAEPWNRKFSGAISGTVVSETAYGQSSNAGIATSASAGDHTHGTPAIASDATISITDITTNNVTTSAHGWAPKGTAGTTQYWRQDWTLGTPGGSTSGKLIGQQILTSGTTYTPTSGTNSIVIELLGGGAAGGGMISGGTGGGGGGSSGGYARKRFTGISGTYAYAIGGGGTGVADGTGNVGGNTTFTGPGSVTVTAFGGKGGVQGDASGFGGESAPLSTNGDINGSGRWGEDGITVSGRGSANNLFGRGGDKKLTAGNGNAGTGFGAGGSGALNTGVASNFSGGSGTAGIIVVCEYS